MTWLYSLILSSIFVMIGFGIVCAVNYDKMFYTFFHYTTKDYLNILLLVCFIGVVIHSYLF